RASRRPRAERLRRTVVVSHRQSRACRQVAPGASRSRRRLRAARQYSGRHAGRDHRPAQGRPGGGGGELHPGPKNLRPHQGTRRFGQRAAAEARRSDEFAGSREEKTGRGEARVRGGGQRRDQGRKSDRPDQRRQGAGERRHDQGPGRRARGQIADRRAGLSDRRRDRGIRLARRAPAFAGRSRRRLAAVQSPRRPRARTQGRRPFHHACAGARRPADHGGDQTHRRARRIRRLARNARDRRFRSADFRGARLSRHAAARSAAGDERLRRVADGRVPMKAPARPGLLLVATRELRWMRRDEVALVLSIIVPVIAFALLTLIFSNAVIRDLRVTVVDADRSATSLTYVQALGSAPGITVAERSGDMTTAMHAIRSGEAIAVVYIPENFERDLLARQRPQIVTLYNRQYYTPGNNANSAISNAVAAATATLPRGADGGGYKRGALVAEQYVLSNPALNYAQFLLRAILPTVLHVVVALAAGYAVGSEFSRRSKRAWLQSAGGRPLVAL